MAALYRVGGVAASSLKRRPVLLVNSRRIATAEVAGSARGVINGLGNLSGFCGPHLVGVMIYVYGQNVAVCALAASLLLAGSITFLLPKECDRSCEETDNLLPSGAKQKWS